MFYKTIKHTMLLDGIQNRWLDLDLLQSIDIINHSMIAIIHILVIDFWYMCDDM